MKKQHTIYLTITIFLLISFLLIAFLIYPTLKDIGEASREISSSKDTITFLYKQSSELDNFKKKYQDYNANLKKIDDLFIDGKDPVDFIKFLEKTASDTNINLDINLTSDAKNGTAGNAISSLFQIYTKGDFLNILMFAQKLETGPYLVRVNNLSVNKLTQDNAQKSKSSRTGANFSIEVLNRPAT